MRSRHEESKARTQKLIKEAYQKGFKDGKNSQSVNKRSAKSSPGKQKNKPK